MHKKFDHQKFESKWQKKWAVDRTYATTENTDKQKTYVLDMFPYPSGDGLHVGHPKGYIATDIYSRFKRMSGHEVLHPMGWDAFGLPAENFAIKNKIHPRQAVEKNVQRFKEQLEILGLDYDWDREINTTDPEFYKWTQWIFIQLFKKGLAYESHEPINWCPKCQTGLANEDVEADGTCERCETQVEKKPMRQWVLKIRDYADRMLEDLDTLAWPEYIKEAQRNWIGRSEGAELTFKLSTGDDLKVFTTRSDTLFGVTYMVIAPEHELLGKIREKIENWDEVSNYIASTSKKGEDERLDATKEKTGIKLEGVTATNPGTLKEIPVFTADYVLGHYGTGAIMAVPAHDKRDSEFATKFNIPVTEVVIPERIDMRNPPVEGKEKIERKIVHAYVRNPKTGKILCLKWKKHPWVTFPMGGVEAGETIIQAARREVQEETGYSSLSEGIQCGGQVRAEYFAAHKDQNRVAFSTLVYFDLVDDAKEPISEEETASHEIVWVDPSEVTTTTMTHAEMDIWIDRIHALKTGIPPYTGEGVVIQSEEFTGMMSLEAKLAILKKFNGETKTTYKLRDWVFSRQRYWGEPIPIIHCEKCGPVALPEDQLPLLLPEIENYKPAGTGESPLAEIESWVQTTCPECGGKGKRETNTMPQWAGSSWYYLRYMDPKNQTELVSKQNEKYWAPVDVYVGGDHAVRHLIYARFWHKFLYDIDVVSTIEPFQRLEFLGFILAEDGRKMSKRWGNVINPDDIITLVGADTLRVYEMFMGPFENTIAWSTDSLTGARRFLERVYGLADHIIDIKSDVTARLLHKTIKKVAIDIESFKFNTAVSSLMIFINHVEKEGLNAESYSIFLKLLAPLAPHITEELWEGTGSTTSIHLESFPEYNETLAKDDMVTIGVQINGKTRANITISPNATEKEALAVAKASSYVKERLQGDIDKVIYVPGRIINLITSL